MDERQQVQNSRVLDALRRHVEQFLEQQTPREEAIRITVEPGVARQAAESDGMHLGLTFLPPEAPEMSGSLRLENTGGNMYAVEARVEDHSRSFSVSVPDEMLEMGEPFGSDILHYLLDQVKRISGERTLRDATANSSDSRSTGER
jgi:hypothetical protein